jgi:hypothetical protein
MTGRTIHYTELPAPQPGSALEAESNTYRREAARLLAEGLEGKHVLIKGNTIIGIYDTDDEAMEEGRRRYLVPRQPYLVHQIQTWERVIRTRS